MSIITDPTGSIYAQKVNWRERPSVRTAQQWVSAEDLNQVRQSLLDLAYFCQLTGGIVMTGSIDALLPSGTIDIGNALEMGVVISGSGVSEYVGFVATNGSGSSIDATIQPNNSITMIALAHASTDGDNSYSSLQLIANDSFSNNGGPAINGQHQTEHLRIHDANGIVRFGIQDSDSVEITGAVKITTVINLSSSNNTTPMTGDIWRSGSDLLYYDGAIVVKIMTGTYP